MPRHSDGDPRGRRLQGEQVIGRWVARMREHAQPPEWAQAAQELDFFDNADEEALDEDDAEADDEADDEMPAEAETEGDAFTDGAVTADEIACIPLNGQLARLSAVQGLVGSPIGVRLKTDGQNPAM